jgi:cytochrome c oxidase cbb3-type subunit 4
MDGITLLRIIGTVASFVLFIVLVLWAWSARNRENFDQAAQLPFEGE